MEVDGSSKTGARLSSMNKFLKKVGWYPITIFGWAVTAFYTALLVYVVIKINADLYETSFKLFALSILSVFFIVLVLFYARLAGERPFEKKK